MNEHSLVLLISDRPANVQTVREILASGDGAFSVQHIERVRTAAARIAGGGVALVLLDISSNSDAFTALRSVAPALPTIVLAEVEDEGLATRLVQEGALRFIARPNWQRELKDCVLGAITRPQASPVPVLSGRPAANRGTVIAVLGAKGGVGATTVAVNVAAALASSATVTLAELRPPFGTLCHFFRPHRAARSLQHLLELKPSEIGPAEVEACLWPNRNIPGLSVLFAPEDAAKWLELGSGHMVEILRQLTALSEVVVVDLAPSLSDANRAILAAAHTLALVVERDALCVDAAKAKWSTLEAAGIIPQEAGLVIVNRVPLASPAALSDIESQLGLPAFAVIPPAADLCAAAYRVHTPVVKLDAQSSMATSLVALAKRLSGRP